jgi:hypothetical protein
MAAPSDYLDISDLKSVAAGGIIREDVVDKIFDCSDIPTPFLDMIGEESFAQPYSEWTEDKLAAPNLTNKVVSGSDVVSTQNKATRSNTKRIGNHAQISQMPVMTTTRQDAVSDVVGTNDEMGFQTARRLQELRRDVEAIALSGQGSVQDDNNATAGQSAGAAAWITTNKDLGATGAIPGFQTGTKLVTAQTVGTTRALSLATLSQQIENVYLLGGMPDTLMSVPGLIKRLAQYLFTTPYAAKPTADVQGTGTGVGQTIQGFVDAFKTDFGFFMKLVPNRLQQNTAANTCNLFGFDSRYWKLGLLYGWKVEALAKLGLSDRKLLHVDWMLKAYLERGNFIVADLNPTLAVTA